MQENGLRVDDPEKTFFTFDCNPTGSDQKYAVNQHKCRIYAREHAIQVYDIDKGIGTHILIEEGLAFPGSTAVSTDSHANILGAIGAFGQGMGDKDIAVAWSKGKVWFKVPPSAKITLQGELPSGVGAKDVVLNLLEHFGSNRLLGYAIELYGEAVDKLSLDERITIASMATEMGAIILIIPPNKEVLSYTEARVGKKIAAVYADEDAVYEAHFELDATQFRKMIARPGKPHDAVAVPEEKVWIDSAFIGSCTNGRLEDIEAAVEVLKGRKVAAHVVLKVVPSTNRVWEQALEKGYVEVLKEAGALISNAGCAGCAAGQVGQNGPGEVTISTGNRNFPGKQGKGEVYLAGPDVVAASAVAGYITSPDQLKASYEPRKFEAGKVQEVEKAGKQEEKAVLLKGRVWRIQEDDIDTDMIFHNRYLAITDEKEMGKYTFDNLKGYEDFAQKAQPGDIVIAGKNFGSGSSRQQAVDCFKALGISAVLAESFGAIYERNAINAAFPILSYKPEELKDVNDGEVLSLDLSKGVLRRATGEELTLSPFSEVQMEIYKNNGLF
jgi:3-isopropylmalate dehydratase small subunit